MSNHQPSRKRQPNRAAKFLKTPKGFALAVLVVLAFVAAFAAKEIDTRALVNILVSVLTGFVVDLLVGLFYKRRRLFSDGAIVTGMIVGMVLSSFTPWYVTAATTAVALLSKHILRYKRKPIFNPAAVGLLFANCAFVTMQSWWGGMSLVSSWFLVVLAIGGFLVTIRVKKVPQVVAFLATYCILCLFLMLFKQTHTDAMYGLENPMINSALFLAFFMLTDPPTSPAQFRDQVWFGCVTAIVSVGIYMVNPAELSYLLLGLMVANALKFVQSLAFSRIRSR